jgi:Glycosyltransferase family 87
VLPLPSRPFRLHLALRLALALWLAFGVAVSVRTLLLPETHTVFPILAASSQHYWHNQPLYARYLPLDYFRYPPGFAVAFTPLSCLGLTAGGIVWSWLSLGVYGWGLWRLRRDVLPAAWTPSREALFLMIGLLGALRGLWNSQSNALAVGLLLLAAAALVRRRWWSAAALLAVPVLVKLTPLAPALLLCALWPRKLAGRFVLALVAGLLLPFVTKSPGAVLHYYQEWLAHLSYSSSERWPGFRDAWTVWQAVRHLLFGDTIELDGPMAHPLLYHLVQMATGLGVLAWCLWQKRRGVERRMLVALTLAMGMAWLMLFGPAVEHATYAFLAPVLAWAAVQRCDWRPARPVLGAALVLILVCGWGALVRSLPVAGPFLLTALPLGTALFAVWVCGYATTVGNPDWQTKVLDGASLPRTGYNSGMRAVNSALRVPHSAFERRAS